MDEDLTHADLYDLDFKVVFNNNPLKVEYAGCGTHEIIVEGKIDLEQARELRDYLNGLKGIDS